MKNKRKTLLLLLLMAATLFCMPIVSYAVSNVNIQDHLTNISEVACRFFQPSLYVFNFYYLLVACVTVFSLAWLLFCS
ncbi:hypothetical protein D0Y65_022018 [Glycine soja]|uniref:Uncharacterized protein n=1 Tax=Glycine soja TaxID=3848 RepID=A0A445JLZ7_GLYSO|nr:hypothetical protein D0Y65_022018 [Glycine soja]